MPKPDKQHSHYGDLDQTDFEIAFYENILKRRPDFVEALKALGELYTKAGLYQKGLAVDEHLSKLRSDDPIVFYNLACSYSLLDRIDEAYMSLGKAVDLGYRDVEHMKRDSDLDNIKQDPRYSDLLLSLKNT